MNGTKKMGLFLILWGIGFFSFSLNFFKEKEGVLKFILFIVAIATVILGIISLAKKEEE